jgi:hypothetical protein
MFKIDRVGFVKLTLLLTGIAFIFSLGLIAERKLHVIDFALSIYFQSQTAKYVQDVNPELIDYFGKPGSLGKKEFNYYSKTNYQFMKKGNIDSYEFGGVIQGMATHFNSSHSVRLREQLRESEQENIEQNIINILGVKEHALGKVVDIKSNILKTTDDYSITSTELFFEHGAIAKYYIGLPAPEISNGNLMITLHGCSSSPRDVMGMDSGDYSNSFGLKSLEKGYVVIAPYTINFCDWIDDLDYIGSLNAGTTVFGYDIMLVQAISEYVQNNLEQPIKDKYLWGISKGGIIAALIGVIDDSYSQVVLDGCAYDFRQYFLNYLLPLEPKDKRTWQFSRILYKHDMVDFAKALLPRRVIIGIGAYDAKDSTIDFVKELRRYAQENYGADGMVKVNFFTGYHETNPAAVLELLELQ